MSFNINFLQTKLVRAKDLQNTEINWFKTNTPLDGLFGSGYAEGATVHVTGYRGCGKTTFLLQALDKFSEKSAFLSNEESIEQLGQKCKRLGVENVDIANMNSLDEILKVMEEYKFVVVDCFTGIVSDLKEKEIASTLISQAKKFNCNLMVIFQMTKNLRERGSAQIPHLFDQTIKLSSGVGSFFCMDCPVIMSTDKNRNGKTGNLIYNHGESGFDFDSPWNYELLSELPKEAYKRV